MWKLIIWMFMFSFCPATLVFGQEVLYGLKFKSYETGKEKRTGLNLTPDQSLKLKDGFSMEFEFMFHSKETYAYSGIFGYIFRIIGGEGEHIDLLINGNSPESPYLTFTTSTKEILFNSPLQLSNQWIKIRIDIDIRNNILCFSSGDKSETWKSISLDKYKETQIVFGKNNIPQFQVTDVPFMSIRNLKIFKQEKLYHFWELSEHTKTGVLDKIEGRFASCENPCWILDEHTFWKKRTSFRSRSNQQIAYNLDDHSIAIVDRENFYSYCLKTDQLQIKPLHVGIKHNVWANQLFYDTSNHLYTVYNLEGEEKGKGFATFDTLTSTWSATPEHNLYPDYLHHNQWFSSKDKKLYLFGGYGHHKYKDGVYSYNFNTESWKKNSYKGDVIQPRYLSGLGTIDEHHVLLFGGYGSENGLQEQSPHYYYDAYIVDTRTMNSKKLWDLPTPEINFAVGNFLVTDTVNHCFYALCFPSERDSTYLQLYRFSMDKPDYKPLADSIPFLFQDAGSYAGLFLDSGNLTAIFYSPEIEDSTSIVSIYSLAYPPLAVSDLFQKEVKNNLNWLWFLISGLLLGIVFILFLQKEKRGEKKNSNIGVTSDENKIETPLLHQVFYLFGGFQVLDKEGKNITNEFTPLLKQLFLIILLNTLKNGKGISSSELREIFWFDKSEESAKNNRRVSLSKLRQIVEQTGAIHIVLKNSYWKTELEKDTYCDYSRALYLIDRLKREENRQEKDLKELLKIVSSGELLPDIQEEWIDQFKSDFSNDLIDILLELEQQTKLKMPSQEQIDLANTIFVHDSLNEDALKIKCRTLVREGKNGLAKNTYDSFIKEYKFLFGVDFKYSFDLIINQKF